MTSRGSTAGGVRIVSPSRSRRGRTFALPEALEPRRLFTDVAPAAFAFRMPTRQALDSAAAGVIAVDVDGDGWQDLVTVHQSSSTVSVSRGLLGIAFAPGVYPVGASPKAVVAADLDGDGRPELITADSDAGTVSVLHNLGDGSFAPAVSYAAGTRPMYVTAVDVDNDGKTDVVAGIDSETTAFAVLRNSGTGTLDAAVPYAGLSSRYWYTGVMSIVPADFDGDGYMDLAAADWAGGGYCPIYQNQGDGTFVLKQTINAGTQQTILAMDVNGDSRPDLVTASAVDVDGVRVWLNGGDWQFARQEALLAGNHIAALQAADLTGEGRPELVAATVDGDVVVLRSTGDGTFVQEAAYAGFAGCGGLAVGDITGDSRPDFVVADTTASLSIIRSRGDGAYEAPSAVLLGTQAWWVVAADFSGDQRVDLGAYAWSRGSMLVARSIGSGRFAAPAEHLLGPFRQAAVAADFDGDGRTDVAAMDELAQIRVMRNQGDGTFAIEGPYGTYGTGSSPCLIVAAEMNGDGHTDLVTAHWNSTSQYVVVDVLLNKGNGTLELQSTRALGLFGGLSSLVTVDLDSDGDADVALTRGDGEITILQNVGSGQLAETPVRLAVDAHLTSLVARDLNNDGYTDLAVLDESNAWGNAQTTLYVLLSDGQGSFAPAVKYDIGAAWFGLEAGDLNGDGYLDLALNQRSVAGSVRILGNRGDGSFSEPVVLSVPAGRLTVADVDGDGRQDLVWGTNRSVDVLFNGLGSDFVPTVTLLRSPVAQENNVLVDFRLSDAESQVCNVDVQYSIDGGKTWHVATAGSGSAPTAVLTSDPVGRTYRFVWNAARDIGPGTGQRVQVKLTASDGWTGMPVISEARVVDIAPELSEPLPLQSGKAVQFTDVDGDTVTIRLTGPGGGAVWLDAGKTSIEELELTGTTERSVLSITVSGLNGSTTVGTIRLVDGSLGKLTTPAVDLVGEGIVGSDDSYIRQIRVHNVFGAAGVHLPGAAGSGSMTIAAGYVFGAQLTFGMPVRLASFVSFGYGGLNAPQISKLVVTGEVQYGDHSPGELSASLNVGDAGISRPLGSVLVAGSIGGIWEIAGAIGTIKATYTRDDWRLHAAGTVGRLQLSDRLSGGIEAAAITTLKVGDSMDDASLQLGGAGITRPLGTASVGGTIYGGTWEIAGSVGSLTVGDVKPRLESWQFHASGTIGRLRVRGSLCGVISAQSVGRMWVGGEMEGVQMSLGTVGATGDQTVLASLYVRGQMYNSVLSGWGDLGAISVGSLAQTMIVAGVDPADDPWTTGELSSTNTIKSLRVRGSGEGWSAFYSSRIAAGQIGSISVVNPDEESPSAILAHVVDAFSVKQWLIGRSETFKWGRQDQPGEPSALVDGIVLQIV